MCDVYVARRGRAARVRGGRARRARWQGRAVGALAGVRARRARWQGRVVGAMANDCAVGAGAMTADGAAKVRRGE